MSQGKSDPAYFDLYAAKLYSGLGRTSLYAKLKNGELEAKKFGKRTLVSKVSLDRMLDSLPSYGKAA